MGKNEHPLVSVRVIAYNSSKTIIETLDSIYNQTYPNIELIISDDCSKDNTVETCRKWLKEHSARFARTEILTVEKNTGLTANVNRAFNACRGEWAKGIAGDDYLLPTCIEDNMEYLVEHPNAIIIFSRPTFMGIKQSEYERYEQKMFDYSFFDMTPEEQYERIKYGSCLPASTMFVSIKGFREKGLFYDERIPMLEDRPLELNAISRGVKMHFFDKQTVVYRVRKDSLVNAAVLSPKFYESTRLAYFYYVFDKNDQIDHDMAVRQVVENEMILYKDYYRLKQFSQTKIFKIANYINNPRLIIEKIKWIFKTKLN